jgi:branched-subunit amino acid aminotransferase/4-amino-4-deoxychorismate lyase
MRSTCDCKHCQFCAAGNYGAGLNALLAARAAGFSDVVYLDARTDTNLEELSAANIFVVKVCSEIVIRVHKGRCTYLVYNIRKKINKNIML